VRSFFAQILGKPYLVLLLALVLGVSGLFAYQNLPLEAYPDVANMQVRVITQVPGKAAEEVEKLVTIPIEKELNGIPHSDPPRSISIFGLSVITVVFDDSVDPYVARQQVLERLANAAIPSNVQPGLDPNASPVGEVFRYTVEGKHWSSMDRKEVQDWILNRKSTK
jgi:cobalt-zinc-cadmium resistance protein CzcA